MSHLGVKVLLGTSGQIDLLKFTVLSLLGCVTLQKLLNLSETSFHIDKRIMGFNRKL